MKSIVVIIWVTGMQHLHCYCVTRTFKCRPVIKWKLWILSMFLQVPHTKADGAEQSGDVVQNTPDSKAHGANMGPIWGREDPGGPNVGSTSNGSWCIGIKGEMSGTVCVTFTWDIYIYIWVVYSFCLFCCLFIIVTWWYMWCIVWQVASKRKYRHVW